jgi:hypothetical protein
MRFRHSHLTARIDNLHYSEGIPFCPLASHIHTDVHMVLTCSVAKVQDASYIHTGGGGGETCPSESSQVPPQSKENGRTDKTT